MIEPAKSIIRSDRIERQIECRKVERVCGNRVLFDSLLTAIIRTAVGGDRYLIVEGSSDFELRVAYLDSQLIVLVQKLVANNLNSLI